MPEYEKKTPREHVLTRPDSYVGSIVTERVEQWVYTDSMEFKHIDYNAGLYKIFDEIAVNAADAKQKNDSVTYIKFTIGDEIIVENNGPGISTKFHEVEKDIRIPTLIFGHLLTSSNYNDNEKKVTGGRNGYGAKLANIFSTEFTVETVCKAENKKFKQTWKDNMSKEGKASVVASRANGYVKISFKPDYRKFGFVKLTNDMKSVLQRRVYDIAGCNPNLSIYLNGKLIRISSFANYCKLFTSQKLISMVSDRWEICATHSEGDFKQMSFVNSINTRDGGTHVDLIMRMIKDEISGKLTISQVKNHTFLFVKCLIENPTFDSQTKNSLTNKKNKYGSVPVFTPAFKRALKASDIKKLSNSYAEFREKKSLNKISGKKSKNVSVKKLEDANEAGTKNNSHKCSLILTEGDSAKTLAISGLTVVGRDYYGVFPLKGKLLNVRDASPAAILKNEEITNIVKILGLSVGKKAKMADMRYGKLIIMTDQDHDGSHIKGLIINFIHHFWPELIKKDDFLGEFITPIIKATKGKQVKQFFTMPEYLNWKTGKSGWKIKYYKGLGTSTSKEAKEYFKDLPKHLLEFENDENADNSIDMAFNKKRANERKQWISSIVPGTFISNVGKICYTDFINKELVLFSEADCIRSIPSVVDGFKPGQRKILFSCFKRKLTSEIKVAQLAGYVSENACYHHGEASLMGTIIGMAQNYVGSNNINLLYPGGQFGTRIMGGKDSASPRYIFTRLTKEAREYFPEDDDAVLNYLNDDGQDVEPEYYVPTIPMALVNGADGIGTGWSTKIPSFNPEDLKECIRCKLNGKKMPEILPWYRGFKGTIEKKAKDSFISRGIFKDGVITELPVGVWTQKFKEGLESAEVDFKDNSGDEHVHFEITGEYELPVGKIHPYSNMYLFGADGKIRKYKNPHDIIDEFFDVRMEFYKLRKASIETRLKKELMKLSNIERFILMFVEEELEIRNKKKKVLEEELEKLKFDKIDKSYNYLLDLSMRKLTMEEVDLIKKNVSKKRSELEKITSTTETQLWLNDLK